MSTGAKKLGDDVIEKKLAAEQQEEVYDDWLETTKISDSLFKRNYVVTNLVSR